MPQIGSLALLLALALAGYSCIAGALALSYAGIALVFMHDLNFAGSPHSLRVGGALVFASAFCYSLYLVGAGTHPGAGVPGVLSSAKVLDRVVPHAADLG